MNDNFPLNDTFDNFTFADTEDFVPVISGENKKKSLTLSNNTKNDAINTGKSQTSNTKDDISFDDPSFFSELLSFSSDAAKDFNKCNNDVILNSNEVNKENSEIQDELLCESQIEVELKRLSIDHSNTEKEDSIDKGQISLSVKSDVSTSYSFSSKYNIETNLNNANVFIKNFYRNANESMENEVQKSNKTNNCELCTWSLPEAVLEKYHSKNVIKMFPWQVECLSNDKVLKEYANLIYSAPTSAGKTLVAEILAIKTVFERKKKVIFILPFVSIVREKMYYFQDILGTSGIRVEGFMGSYNPPGGFESVQIAICTIEKANSLINRLLEEGNLSHIGAILVDEVHLLGDPSRGYILELLLTKLRYISLRDANVNIQIIGMSATLPNLNHLAEWLGAELYTTTFRPIPLYEQAIIGGEIFNNELNLVRKLKKHPELEQDTDNVLQLCLETIKENCSILIFCPTKNWCENLSQQIAMAFYKLGKSAGDWSELLRSQLKTDLIMELLEQLKYCPVGLDDILRKTCSFGVAFHHAGLTMDERDIIEGGFRSGSVRVLVATSTLSSGVNLPARRVIIRTPIFHGKPIDPLVYRQMIGRAGRMGKDDIGESFLICQKNDFKIAQELMSAHLQPVESCLEGAGKLKRAILEVIASGVASSPEDVDLFTKCTLLAVGGSEDNDLLNPIKEAIDFLSNNEFIRLKKLEDGGSKYMPTSLGKACLSSSMAPDEGLALFTELEKARQCFVLETELHLIYLVTPYTACNQWGNMDWMLYLELWEKLPASMKRVGELVGVRESYLVNATRGRIQTNTSKLFHKLLVHKRFFVALALQDLVNEKFLGEVCNKFNCNRGMLQSLQQSASSFAGMVTSFSRQLGWGSVEILISQFQDRLQFGVSRDLLDLMRLPVLNAKMARTLYNAGIETLIQLANSDVETVEIVLLKSIPFESGKERDGESEFAAKQRNKFRTVWVTGKEGLTEREAAEMLLKDARNYLKMEIGLVEAKWDTNSDGDTTTLSTSSCKYNIEEIVTKDEILKTKTQVESSQKSNQGNTQKNSRELLSTNELNLKEIDDITKLREFSLSKLKSIENIDRNYAAERYLDIKKCSTALINTKIGNQMSKSIKENMPNCPQNNIAHGRFKTNIDKLPENNKQQRAQRLLSMAEISSNEKDIKKNTDILKSEAWRNKVTNTLSEPNDLHVQTPEIVKIMEINKVELNNNKNLEHDDEKSITPEHNRHNLNELNNTPDLEVSKQILLSPSCSELNTSCNSLFSNCSLNDSLNKAINSVESDQSIFNDSFPTLHLSDDSSGDSGVVGGCGNLKTYEVNDVDDNFNELATDTFLEKAFSGSFSLLENNGLTDTSSEDIFSSPNDAEKNHNQKKRNRLSIGEEPTKKKKTSTSENSIDNFETTTEDLNSTYFKSKLLPEQVIDLAHFEIIDVCANSYLFETFIKELKEQNYFALSIACTRVEEAKSVIGLNVNNTMDPVVYDTEKFCYKNRKIEGFSVVWGENTVYYLSLKYEKLKDNVIKLLRVVLENRELSVKIFDSKEQIKVLKQCCNVDIWCSIEDPKVADWILDPEGKEKNLQAMAVAYSSESVGLAQLSGNCKGVGSISLDLHSSVEPRLRSSVEALVTWYIVDSIKNKLQDENTNYLQIFGTEMATVRTLAKIECAGIGISKTYMENLVDTMQNHLSAIEKKAHCLAGRRFSLASSSDVAKVIGMFRGRKVSTRKEVLEQNNHPISDLVLQWRKISCTLTKMMFPLIRVIENERIHGCYVTNTSTGRISMHEPNLQNMAKDFDMVHPITKDIVPVSSRSAFQAVAGCMLVSADYCQLELRILAHLSHDKILCGIMRSPGDVFTSIAAKWNNVEEAEVNDNLRQKAKHICYGIIYGMGSKTLAEQLSTPEEEAAEFMESFRNRYPGVKRYIIETIEKCRKNGYVETVAGRKRFLPHITDANLVSKGQAERQAVNTTVQGSAADVVKKTMVKVDEEIENVFRKSSNKPKLILHLHDELIYEVTTKYVKKVAKILKRNMEDCVELSVPFPVKLKTGRSWGEMTDYSL